VAIPSPFGAAEFVAVVDDHVELAARGVRPFAGASVAIVEQTESICDTVRRLD